MKTELKILTAAVAALAVASIISTPNSSVILLLFSPPSIPHSRDHLQAAALLQLAGAFGPESIAFDPAGNGPYTGVADGRILKWTPDAAAWTDFAVTSSNRNDCVRPFAPEMEHVCGRPLGLRFHNKTGHLYIADAYLGLHVVGPDGGLATSLVSVVEGRTLRFTNDMDIDEQADVIYFTDTSTQFQRREFMSSILSGDMTGRLMKYDRSNKQVSVLLRGLAFANGVALSQDRSFLLVAETTSCRIIRFWLDGPRIGECDVFSELPGFPDNIRRNSDGDFWVALHAKKGKFANWIVSNHWVGRTLLRLPLSFKQLHYFLVGGQAHATAIKLSKEGNILEVLEDCDGKTMRFVSEVEEKDGKLWIGSVLMPFIGTHCL
uniref:Strictosidine synthase conserved region domain-containing protein n=1 Tax=Kalanchoe fedtschenkoi TaxID=63787 RepID=A0A7N0TSY0_KALFE